MRIHVIEQSPELNHVAFVGSLDIPGTQEAEPELLRKLVSHHSDTLIDLSKLDYAGSLGIGLLFGAFKSLMHQGRIVLYGAQPSVENTMRLVRLDHLCAIVPTLADAQAVLAQPSPQI